MDKNRIEEVRKSFNLNNWMVFDYVVDGNLWIVGGYGPIDFGYTTEAPQEKPTVRIERPTLEDLPNGIDSFLPYLTECDAAEGFNVFKFRYPFIDNTGDILDVDIFIITCTNNGTTYFACENIDVLRAFTLSANEGIRKNRPKDVKSLFNLDDSFAFERIDWLDWWLISNSEYASVECWPSDAKWISTSYLPEYSEMLYPHISKDGKPRELKSFCWFTIPFWNEENILLIEPIFAIKCADNTMYFASYNQDALRSALLLTNYSIKESNKWREEHPGEVYKHTPTVENDGNNITINLNGTISGDFIMRDKHIGNQVNGVKPGGTGVTINKNQQ